MGRFVHFHPECARDDAHENDGDDVCSRCGLDLHAITEDHCSCEKCCGDIDGDDWEAARIYYGLDDSFQYSNTQMREYIALHRKADD